MMAPGERPHCRACGGADLAFVLDLGKTPLADRLLTAADLGAAEATVPLEVVFCPACALVQLTVSVPPEELFCNDYPYYSSVSPSLVRHFQDAARRLIDSRALGPNNLVVEAGSNDGTMLKAFAAHGIDVLGIDPAAGPAGAARDAGIPTRGEFFTRELAHEMRHREGLCADLFVANNVLAHVPDLNGFVAGVRVLLSDTGAAQFEVPYVVDLIEACAFDTIYHQHLCYFSLTALEGLMRRHGLFVNDVTRLAVHGGSLRLLVAADEAPSDAVRALREREAHDGVGTPAFYEGFADRVARARSALVGLLRGLKEKGKRIAGYGAAAKATTLMSHCGIDGGLVDYVVDANPVKQGRFMGGNRLPIAAPETLLEDRPDYVVLFAWNLADEIIAEQQAYAATGGHFIVPVPEARIVGGGHG